MSINRKACKKHCEIEQVENVEKFRFEDYIETYGETKLINKLLEGRLVKPCDMECYEFGYMIARGFRHTSFVNFKQLMNDKEFLLEIAKITPKPTECYNYFWLYINPYLKKDKNFRYEFLKAVYLNDEVYEVDVIKTLVEFCGLGKENKQLLKDDSFKLEIEQKLHNVNYEDCLHYHCSGNSKNEIHNYKVKANKVKVYCQNVREGLKQILSTFESSKVKEVDIRDLIETQFFVFN